MLSADRRAREARARALRWDPAFPPQADNDGTTRLTPEEADYRLTEDVNTSCKQCIFRLDNGDGTSACQRVVQTVDSEHVCDLVELPELADGKQAPGGPANGPVRHISRRYSEDQPRDADGRFGSGDKDAVALTKEQTSAIKSYTGFGYGPINAALRGTDEPRVLVPEEQKSADTWKQMGDAIHSAMQPTTANQTVYRGISADIFSGGQRAGYDWSKAVGMTITDKGFPSTTTDEAKGIEWDFKGAIAVIDVPKGTSALSITPKLASNPDLDEKELLLDRGLTFHVTSVDVSKVATDTPAMTLGKHPIVHMEVVSA